MNKKVRSQNPLKPKALFKWFFMDIVPALSPKCLRSETTFSYYILIIDASSKITKLYGMERVTTEEIMDRLDMFHARFGKIDKFGWWDLEIISADSGTHFAFKEF